MKNWHCHINISDITILYITAPSKWFIMYQQPDNDDGAKFEGAASVATTSTSSQEEPETALRRRRGRGGPTAAAVRVESNEEGGFEVGLSARHNISLTRYYSATVTEFVEEEAPPAPPEETTAPKVFGKASAWVANSLEDFSGSSQGWIRSQVWIILKSVMGLNTTKTP